MLANTPLFLVNLSCFSSCTLSFLAKLCFAGKHYTNSVFSRTQLLGITDSKAPYQAPSQNGTFATKSAIFGFSPVLAETPIFVVFGDFEWAQKRTIFQKQIVATMNTNSVPCCQKMPFYHKKRFSSQPPKNTIVLFFENFLILFSIFSLLLHPT